MSTLLTETVTSVHHWTDSLFSFRTTRSPAFRFLSGQFTMIGLRVDERPLLRAYSIASAHYTDHLEFLSIKVEDGPLTSRLRHIEPGDEVLVGRKATGTLLSENLKPGRRLYMLATGTGLAPFLSLLRDPEVFDRFDTVVIVHGCRLVSELAYRDVLTRELPQDPLLGEVLRDRLIYHPTVTREPFATQGRITDLMRSGRLYDDLGLPAPSVADDRFMICGSMAMLNELKTMLSDAGYAEGSSAAPGEFVIERAFVD
ncbi:MAG TPA: ferredoxin--NADP reductase [Paracoccus sp.]|nr:ferredoxin--NADP reductase [Paracoccus sp. (in: a-proteobacteria)]